MKKLRKDELYKNLSAFLQTKGVELKDGSITARIQQGCCILSDTINFAQANVQKVRTQMDQKLDRMREVIHEKTAPKDPSGSKSSSAAKPSKAKSNATKASATKAKARKPSKNKVNPPKAG